MGADGVGARARVCESVTGDGKWNPDSLLRAQRGGSLPGSLARLTGEMEQNLLGFANDFINHDEKVFVL